jgi:uncharacterized protein (DUF305 family)
VRVALSGDGGSSRMRARGKPRPRLCPLAAGILVALLISDVPAWAKEAVSRPDKARFEVQFMKEMIDHHAMAVDMGKMCLEKAEHAKLRRLCKTIISSQTCEIERMREWLEKWYGVSHDSEMKPGHERKMEKLASLSSRKFEIGFLEMMIHHRRLAVQSAKECVDRAHHRRLGRLCRQIIRNQSQEIDQMQAWLLPMVRALSERPRGGERRLSPGRERPTLPTVLGIQARAMARVGKIVFVLDRGGVYSPPGNVRSGLSIGIEDRSV